MRADAPSAPNGEGVFASQASFRGASQAEASPSRGALPWQGRDHANDDEWRAPNFILSRKVVPALVLLFLLTLAAARLTMTIGDRSFYVDSAHKNLATVTALLSTSLKLIEASGGTFDHEAFLQSLVADDVLPTDSFVFVTDRDGVILSVVPRNASQVGTSVYDLVSDPRELVAADASQGITRIGFMGSQAISTTAQLPQDGGKISVFWPEAEFLAKWQQKTAVGVSLFALTGAIMLLVLKAYFQIGRASCRERVCQYV